MEILKPYDHTALTRISYYGRSPVLSVSVIGGFQLTRPEQLLTGATPWKVAGELLDRTELLDEGYAKPKAEFLAAANAYAPNGTPVTGLRPAISLAGTRKELLAFGNRYWLDAHHASQPIHFTSLPITWEQAYGGSNTPVNTRGKGAEDQQNADGSIVRPLPNIELPGHAMQQRSACPAPASFSPLPIAHPIRESCHGTYDEAWMKEHAPGFAPDTDPAFFHCAPPDQRLGDWLHGGEPFVLEHLHPDHARLEGRLPDHRIRAFVFGRNEWAELTLHLDTVWFMPDADAGVLIWHGNIRIKSEATSPWTNLLVGYEAANEMPRPDAHYQAVHARWIDPAKRFSDLRLERSLVPDAVLPPTFLSYSDPYVIEQEFSALEEQAEGESVLSYPEQWPVPDIADSTSSATQPRVLRAGLQAMLLSAGTSLPVGQPSVAKAREALQNAEMLDENIQAQLDSMAALEARAQGLGDGSTDLPIQPQSVLKARREKLLSQIADGISCAGQDWSGLDLLGLELAGCNFQGSNLSGVNAAGVNWQGANLQGTNLSHAKLSGANFSQANLSQSNLSCCSLEAADLSGADVQQSRWVNVQAKSIRLDECRLSGAEFSQCVLCGASAIKADLGNTLFMSCNLDNAMCEGASLVGASFLRCDLKGFMAKDCVATTLLFHACDLTKSDWSQAQLNGSVASGGTSFEHASLIGASMEGVNWSKSKLTQADLSHAVLTKSTFCHVEAQGIRLEGADAVGSIWNQSDLTGARAAKVNLMKAALRATNLTRASFHGANLYEAGWQAAICHETDIGDALFADHIKKLMLTGILP